MRIWGRMRVGDGIRRVTDAKDGAKSNGNNSEADGHSIRPWSVVQASKKRVYDQQDERLGHFPSMPSEMREQHTKIWTYSGSKQIGHKCRSTSTTRFIECPVIEQARVGPAYATGQQETGQSP